MLPSRCPHCQAELPDRGRFCVMCGCRVEGWAGLLPTTATVPQELPSEHDHTRPVTPTPALLQAIDEEAMRPTREMPSVGHELRALAPDHRVHTSPTGHILPTGVQSALGAALESPGAPVVGIYNPPVAASGPVSDAASGSASGSASGRVSDDGGAVPGYIPDEATEHVVLPTRSRLAETLHLSLLSLVCACVAVLVGLFAYRLLTRPIDGGALVLGPEGAPPPAPEPSRAPAPRARPQRQRAARADVHRTRDLVVHIAAVSARKNARPAAPAAPLDAPAGAQIEPTAAAGTGLGSASGNGAGASPGASSPGASLGAAPAIDEAPLSEAEQRAEAEAQVAAADIEFVASTHNAQVRACHERAFKDAGGQSPGGKLELAFTLNEDGRAVAVRTALNTTGSELLARCLEARVAEWRFPRPLGGAKQYQFPFVFMPTAGGR